MTTQLAPSELTPCGRVPNTRLRNPRHEIVAHETVAGKSPREAGLAAGYKDTPGLAGNIIRLKHTPELRERINELAQRSVVLAEVYAGWVLSDIKLMARASLSRFWKRDAAGKLELNNGHPIVDFSKATEDDIRTLSELSYTERGPKLKLCDTTAALDKLGRYLGLFKDKVALTDPSGEHPFPMTANVYSLTDAELLAIATRRRQPIIRLTGRPAGHDSQLVASRPAEDKREQELPESVKNEQ